jgi:hypothetical protein
MRQPFPKSSRTIASTTPCGAIEKPRRHTSLGASSRLQLPSQIRWKLTSR